MPDKGASNLYGLSATEPNLGVYGFTTTAYNTQQGCTTATPDSDYSKTVYINGACLLSTSGGGIAFQCSSSSMCTTTVFSDAKCTTATGSQTQDIKATSCLSPNSKGQYTANTCTIEPPKAAADTGATALGIGLGVGLGGGALLIGGGAAAYFFYFKALHGAGHALVGSAAPPGVASAEVALVEAPVEASVELPTAP